MIKLYGGAKSRASIVRWYLEELKIPYEFVMLDLSMGEHLYPAIVNYIQALSNRPACRIGMS